MTVSDGAGKELSKLSYTYDLAGNKLTSTETVDGKARETYSYGKGRASYLNNQTGDSYNYLTNQSGFCDRFDQGWASRRIQSL